MRVLLAFDDSSLGGTSRSALLYATLWQDAGADVLVYSPRGLHERRAQEAHANGVRLTTDLATVRSFGASLVHLHHAAPSAETISWVRALSRSFPEDVVVITHNVFGQPLPVELGRHVVVGVLGDWVGAQYRLQAGRSALPVRVMPNPQDFDFFRTPSSLERQQARSELGMSSDERVVLRVGSPTEEKWSRAAYTSLAQTVGDRSGVVARFIGAPRSYDFANSAVTIVHEPLADVALRREYWAADVFAHWADRGESFGNVLLEALGTGLPVVYRAVPTRDNTPAEFRGLQSFDYVTSTAAWLDAVFRERRGARDGTDQLLRRYSSDEMLERLSRIVEGGRGATSSTSVLKVVLDVLPEPRRPGLRDAGAVAVRHNPLTAVLKQRRLRSSR